MPTRYKAQAYQPAPAWLSIWKYMYSELERNAVSILRPTGFYDAHDIQGPAIAEGCKIGSEESAAIARIATALTIAADGAHRTAPGIVAAWLERVASNPTLLRSKQLPPEVHWAIASNYRRHLETPATHLQDVWSRRRVRFEAKARRPSLRNIARAARMAKDSLRRERGRPRNLANRLLAEYLASAFRSFGGRIARRLTPVDVAGGGVLYVDDGLFYHFLESVTGPLQKHLERHGLSAVSIETIERIATEDFALNAPIGRPFLPTHSRSPSR